METYFFTLADGGGIKPGDNWYQDGVVILKEVERNMEAILTLAIVRKEKPRICIEAVMNWSHFLLYESPRSEIIRLSLRLAESEQLNNLLARCLQMLGDILYRLEHYDESQQMLSDSQAIFEIIVINDVNLEYLCNKLPGIIFVLRHGDD